MKLPCPWALPKDGRAQSSSCHCHMAEVTWETRGSVPDSQTSDTGMGGRPRGLCPSGPGTPVRPGARPRLGPARAASPLCSPPQHGREPPCAGFGEHAPGRMCAGGTHTEPQRWGHSKEGTRRPGGPARLAAAGAASPPPRAAGDGKSSRSRVLRVPRGGVALRRAQGCGAEQTVFQACMPAVRGSGRAHTTVHQNRPRHSSPHGPDALHRLPDQGQGAAERPGSSGAAAAGGGGARLPCVSTGHSQTHPVTAHSPAEGWAQRLLWDPASAQGPLCLQLPQFGELGLDWVPDPPLSVGRYACRWETVAPPK